MLQIKFGYDWPTDCGDIEVWKCLRTDGRRIDWYTISSPWAFGSGELKMVKITWPRWSPCPYMVKTSKIFFRTKSPMMLKLGMQHLGLELYKMYMNDYPGLTLTYFMARSTLVAYVFELGKLLQKPFNGKNLQQMTKLTKNYVFENILTTVQALSTTALRP